jgi:hypothetical protein
MKEAVLAKFLSGESAASALAADLAGSEVADGIRRYVRIEDMNAEFNVTREMAVRLCDVVLRGELEPQALRLIGFALVTSDRFTWTEDDVLGAVLADWSCPEVHLALSIENVAKFRSWLDGSALYPKQSMPLCTEPRRLISETRRVGK